MTSIPDNMSNKTQTPESARQKPMKITTLSDAQHRHRHIAIGEFDGVHLGHRDVIRGADTVLTFEPHPRSIVAPQGAPKLITPLSVKADLIATQGVEELVVIPFDNTFAHQSPQEFIDRILVDKLSAAIVSVGENFRFGHRASGDVNFLGQHGSFETRISPLVEVEGEVVTSTHIRGLIVAGDVESANRFLGSEYQIRGVITNGDGRGHKLGFPTANIVPDEELVHPGNGVYACRAVIPSQGPEGTVPAAVNVGVSPTFDTGRGVLIEAYLLDFEGDLYGQELRLKFISRLRGERRFDTSEELVEEMHRDVEYVRRTLT